MQPIYDYVTFDCYGTLIDWERGIADAFVRAAARDGVQPALLGQVQADEGPQHPARPVDEQHQGQQPQLPRQPGIRSAVGPGDGTDHRDLSSAKA